MKKAHFLIVFALAGVVLLANTNRTAGTKDAFMNGNPEIKSVSALAFGPNGILFVGDSKNATVFAIDTKDVEKVEKAAAVDVKKIDQKIATALGTDVQNVTVTEIVVNPLSKKVYVGVGLADGTPAVLKLEGEKITPLNLKEVSYTSIALNNAPAEDAKDQRGRP